MGSFKLGLVLGRGAMGEVYEATAADGRVAAVKLLNQRTTDSAGHVARFHREMAVAAKLSSPYIVRVYELSPPDAPVPYIAMERATGGAVTHAADVYALGAIAYRCLTGRAPFQGRDFAELVYQVVHAAPIRPSLLGRVPRAVEDVLAVAMAKDPRRRFPSALAFAQAFAEARRGRPAALPTALPAALPTALPALDVPPNAWMQ